MAPKRARKNDHEHEWTDFEKHTLLCLMAKGEHLAPRGKRTDDPRKLRQHAYLEVATNLNFACHGNKYDEDIDKRDVAKMIDQMMVEKKGVLGYGGYMERSTAGRITRGLKRMVQKNTKLDHDGTLSEWNNGRKAKEAEKLRIANGGAPRDDTDTLFHDGEEDGAAAAPSKTGRPRGDLWAQADVAATSSRTKWRGAQAELHPSIEVDEDAGPRVSSVVDNGHDSFRQLPPSLRRNEKFQWAAGGASLPPKPIVSAPGHGVASSRMSNEKYRDLSAISSLIGNPDLSQATKPAPSTNRSSYANPPSAIPSYELHVEYPQSSSSRPTEGFADTRLNLPPKPPNPKKEPRKVGVALPDDAVNVFSKPFKSPKKSAAPPMMPTMPLNRAFSRDSRLAYSLNAEVRPATSTQPRWPGLPTKPKDLLQETINPARRALMETTNRESGENDDADNHTARSGHKVTSSNKEALPFNRLDKARSGSTGSRDLEMEDTEQ